MTLENDRQLENTKRKLTALEAQIETAKARPRSPENDESLQSLAIMANQLREEIVRYEANRKRRAS